MYKFLASKYNFPKKQYFKQISKKYLFNIAGILNICNRNNSIEVLRFTLVIDQRNCA